MKLEKHQYKVEVIFSDKKRRWMAWKKPAAFPECLKGKRVVIYLDNKEAYSGCFAGMDGEDTIMLDAFSGKSRIGLPLNRVSEYLEQISKPR